MPETAEGRLTCEEDVLPPLLPPLSWATSEVRVSRDRSTELSRWMLITRSLCVCVCVCVCVRVRVCVCVCAINFVRIAG